MEERKIPSNPVCKENLPRQDGVQGRKTLLVRLQVGGACDDDRGWQAIVPGTVHANWVAHASATNRSVGRIVLKHFARTTVRLLLGRFQLHPFAIFARFAG